MGDWPILLVVVVVGYVLGRVRPLRQWIGLNQILASAGRLGRRDRVIW